MMNKYVDMCRKRILSKCFSQDCTIAYKCLYEAEGGRTQFKASLGYKVSPGKAGAILRSISKQMNKQQKKRAVFYKNDPFY